MNYEEDFNEKHSSKNIQDLMDIAIETSMLYIWDTIEEVGISTWIKSTPVSQEMKISVLDKMRIWFEAREEFEKCSLLKKGIESLESID